MSYIKEMSDDSIFESMQKVNLLSQSILQNKALQELRAAIKAQKQRELERLRDMYERRAKETQLEAEERIARYEAWLERAQEDLLGIEPKEPTAEIECYTEL